MLELHPTILEKDGKKEFAILPYEKFEKILEELEDYADLKDLLEAKAEDGDAPTQSLESVRKELGI